MPEIGVINDNYIQMGPQHVIQAGTKKIYKDNVFELIDDEDFEQDKKIFKEQIKSLIYDSKQITIEEKGQIIQLLYD